MDFISIVASIFFIFLVPMAGMGIHWLGARVGDLIQAKVKNERLRAALLRLEDAVVTAVKDVEQTLVVEYRELARDGKLSREDRRRLKETAVRKVKTFLGSAGLKELGNVLDVWVLSVEDLIGAKVEATILDMKTATPPAAPTTIDVPATNEVAS